MIEQPQSDANHQPNQLELEIPNQTPAVVDLVLLSCILAIIENLSKGRSSTHRLYLRLNSINKHLKVCLIV